MTSTRPDPATTMNPLAFSLSLQGALLQSAATFLDRAAHAQAAALQPFQGNGGDGAQTAPPPRTPYPRMPARKLPLTVEDVKEGTESVYVREIRDSDIQAFADASGDVNPIHLDEDFAKTTFFNGRIAHGILSAGLISAALSQLPGTVIYMSQDLKFTKPVRPGDVITTRARVTERLGSKAKFRLTTTCENQDGEVVVDGEATVLLLPETK